MTDGKAMQLARRIDAYQEKIRALCLEIEKSEHPRSAEMYRDLASHYIDNPASAEHVVHRHLIHPERCKIT